MTEIDIDSIRAAEPRALGRAITLVESNRDDHRRQAERLLSDIMPYTGNSLRIGITGVPGVGKSTFIDCFGRLLIDRGHRVAVLSVDPSSSISGGSILGDKTRMPGLAASSHAFIRPSPAGVTLGGVARRTREAILLCEAAGFDRVIVETVGVGQSETLVAEMTDLFMLMLLPAAGDDLQGIKRGIMELADIVVMSKSDGDLVRAAGIAVADVQHALELIKPRMTEWCVPVVAVSSIEQRGIDDVLTHVERYRESVSANDELTSRRQRQATDWLWRETAELLVQQLRQDASLAEKQNELQQQVRDGKIAPTVAARILVDRFINSSPRS